MPDDSRRIFQENLLYYMAVNKVSQQDIVTALGVSKSTVSDWCHGKNYPRIDVMQKLADYFGIVMNKLVIANDHSDELTDEEKTLIDIHRSLPREGKNYLMQQAQVAQVLYGKKSDPVSNPHVG